MHLIKVAPLQFESIYNPTVKLHQLCMQTMGSKKEVDLVRSLLYVIWWHLHGRCHAKQHGMTASYVCLVPWQIAVPNKHACPWIILMYVRKAGLNSSPNRPRVAEKEVFGQLNSWQQLPIVLFISKTTHLQVMPVTQEYKYPLQITNNQS